MEGNLFGWPDWLWLALDQAGILAGDVMLIIGYVGLAVGIARREALRRWLVRNRFPRLGGDLPAGDLDGIVFTVSRFELPARLIEAHRPAHVGLVASQVSRGAAERLAALARDHGLAVYGPRYLVSAHDVAEARDATAALLAAMRAAGAARPAVELTGGTVPMSLGAFAAAEEAGVPSLYVAHHYQGDKPDARTARLVALSRP